MIWTEAVLEDIEPGICIPRVRPEYADLHEPVNQVENAGEERLQPLTVNCKLSVIFHVNRESRHVAKRTVRHKQDESGACFGAWRDYDPRIDVLFLSLGLYYSFRMGNWSRAAEIQHIGITWPSSYTQWLHLTFIIRNLPKFQNVQRATMIETGDIDPYYAPTTQFFRLQSRELEPSDARLIALGLWFGVVNRFKLPMGVDFDVDVDFADLA
ncbi:hypothetical protein M434DRAFT_35530 [Hypoxylon sp. CO27-5]|nr:hypothetical protein M434DRAFT_35530 [Hypoxylon sp. CO27-5]